MLKSWLRPCSHTCRNNGNNSNYDDVKEKGKHTQAQIDFSGVQVHKIILPSSRVLHITRTFHASSLKLLISHEADKHPTLTKNTVYKEIFSALEKLGKSSAHV